MRPPSRLAIAARGLVLCTALAGLGCAARANKDTKPSGQVSAMTAQRYIKKAIRSSSEGVILMPSVKAEQVYELARLNEIAQGMRGPAAKCFITRAIESMRPRADGEGFDGVPEGQMKVRARVAPSGEVVRAEVLETGFTDEEMDRCVTAVVEQQRFPTHGAGVNHFIDVVYWVSLGSHAQAHTKAHETRVRRETVAAAVRAKPCVQGRVDAGSYPVRGLNLVDREGGTLINRVEQADLPGPIRACIARAFRDIRIARDADSFVRPIETTVELVVDRDGMVGVVGEDWLHHLELEERARLAQERANAEEAARQQDDDLPPRRPDEPSLGAAAAERRVGSTIRARPTREPGPGTEPEPEPGTEPEAEPEPAPPKGDPGRGGTVLPLSGRRG